MELKTDIPVKTITRQLNKRVPQLMTEMAVPGLSMALIRDAQLVWAQGFGVMDVGTEAPVTTETFFEGCSLSKPPFAYAALKLHEQKVIDLDMPLATYLPEPDLDGDPRAEMITMRMVLSHTCGLPNWRPKDKPLNLHLTPGDRFSYSGEGYMYLQKVIEHITGQAGETFMQSTLFQPLGMTQSSYLWSKEHEQPIATGHDSDGKPAKKFYPEAMWAAASLHTTPTEFAQFMIAMMRPKPNNETYLSPHMSNLMLTPRMSVNDSAPWHDDWPKEQVTEDENVSWGLGWGLQHTTTGDSFWHWGDNFTFKAFAVGFPEKGCGVVIMTNSTNGDKLFEQVCQEAIGGAYPGLGWLRGII